jgi:L-amino acid N-acyltransferase YncA
LRQSAIAAQTQEAVSCPDPTFRDSMKPAFSLRASEERDLAAIAAIYAHHVLHGLASFELDPPDAAEMGRRRAHVLALGLPYIVAELDGRVVGYAYAAPYRDRPAYRYTLEDSIYIARDATGLGAGRALLEALVTACAQAGYRQMVAVIGDSANQASIGLHAACGFSHAGLLPGVGFKFGRWVDSVFMQRALGEGEQSPPLVPPQAK